MNLLDMLGNDGLMFGLQLMNAGRAQPVRQNLAGGLLDALGGLQAQRNAEEDRKAKQQAQAAHLGLLGAQLEETKAQAQQRQAEVAAKEAAAQRSKAFGTDLLSMLQGTTPEQALAATGAGPTPQAAALIGQRQPPNWQALAARYPEQVDHIAKLAATADLGRPEVARTIEVMGPNGPETVQFDKFGNRIGAGVAKPFELKMQDLGGKVAPLNPYTGQQVGAGLGKTMTPGEIAANSLGWANNAVSRDRLGWEKQQADKPVWDADRGILVNQRSGQAMPAMLNGQPVGAKDKGLNDTQAKALLFGSRMQESDRILGELAKAGVEQPSLIKRAAEGVPLIGGALGTAANATVASDKQQQVEQAQRDFVNAVLRRESGAAISNEEFGSAARQYFPQPGDSPAVIAQKAKNRALATQLMLAEVPDGKRMQPTAPAATPAAPVGFRVIDSPAAPAGFRILGKE